MIYPGQIIQGEIVGGSNDTGLFDVSVGGSSPFLKVPVAHRKDQYFSGMDCVLGFINTDSPVIISRGFKRTLPAFMTAVTANAYPWRCRWHDSFNSKRASYPFVYVAEPALSWQYSLPTSTTGLCIALINNVDYILVGGTDRAVCINENGSLVWETLLPNPGLTGSLYSCQGFISGGKFHSCRGWFNPGGNSISVSIDILNIETGEWIEQTKSTWSVGASTYFSAKNFYIKPSNNDNSYSFPMSVLKPNAPPQNFASTIFTQSSGFEAAPENCLFNINDLYYPSYPTPLDPEPENFVSIGDYIYIATRRGLGHNSGGLADRTNKIVKLHKNGSYAGEEEFTLCVSTNNHWIDTSTLPSYYTIHSDTHIENETITFVKAYVNEQNTIQRVFVLTSYQIKDNNTTWYEANYDPVEYWRIDTSVEEYHTKLYIYDGNLNPIKTIDWKRTDKNQTRYFKYGESGEEIREEGYINYDYYLTDIRTIIDAGANDYSIIGCLKKAWETSLVSYIKESGLITTIPGYVGNPTEGGRIYDPDGGFVDSNGKIYDNLGNLLVTKAITLSTDYSDIASGKNGIYAIDSSRRLMSKL